MIWLFIFLLGAVIGSFLNVVIIRLPKEESVVFPASHCVHCDHPLRWYHNIPLFSWLALRGRCAFCQGAISIQYPLIEALSGLLFVSVLMKLGITPYALGVALSFDMLLVLSAIDWRYKMVPDSINLLALTLAILSATSLAHLWHNALYALLFAGGFSLLRFYLSYLTGKEAMGEADIMIAATMGALLGAPLALVAVFIGAIVALPPLMIAQRSAHEEDRQLPFIPFLALGTWITLMASTPINAYLASLYG